MNTATEYLPAPGEFDPLAGENAGQTETGTARPVPTVQTTVKLEPPPVFRLLTLSEMRNYEPPIGSLLVGDGVLELGEIALLYGPPGSFKGFAVGDLMACGARGQGRWLGHAVQARFASLWLNCENGPRRLRDQFRKLHLPPEAEQYIHVTDIPSVWNLADGRMAAELRRVIVEKHIRLLVIDTVSNFMEDEFAKQFATFFASLNTIVAGLEIKPAILLIHHSRKPKESDKGARGLLNLISGHQTLQRRARSICYLGRVTDEFEEKRVAAVWLKVSNNGEAEGCKTALQLGADGSLEPIEHFDWSEWSGGSSGAAPREAKLREEHIREVFGGGKVWLEQKRAAERLMEVAGVGRSAAYAALKVMDGRFSHLLTRREDGMIGLRTGGGDAEDGAGGAEE